MDFRGIVDDTTDGVYEIINDILRMNLAPDEKTRQIQSVLMEVGERFGQKMFDDVSQLFDSTAIKSTVPYNDNDRVYALAQKIVRDSAFELNDKYIVEEYHNTVLGMAEALAFANAQSLEKHPTLTRRLKGETCDWCVARAGTWVDPEPTLFARHHNCDCVIKVRGFNSRNGKLKNYRKD